MSLNSKFYGLLLLLCAVPAQAVNIYSKDGVQFDVFGRVQAVGVNSHAARVLNSEQNPSGKGTIQSSARLGIAGRSKLNDTFSAIGVAEFEFRSSSDQTRLRYAYAGVDANRFGILTFGRGDSAYYTVAGVTDIYHRLDSRVNDYYLLGEQRSGQIMYSLSAMGWDLRASYNTAVNELDEIFNIKRNYAIAVSTHLANSVSLSYGYAMTYFSYSGDTELNQSAQTSFFKQTLSRMHHTQDEEFLLNARPGWRRDVGAALSYGIFGEGLYAALVYSASKYDGYSHHVASYEAVADYTMQCGLSFTAGYGQQRFGSRIIMSDLNLGLGYKPVPNFKIFAEAQLDLGASPEKLYGQDYIERYALAENKYVLGAELDF
ncbi:MAG: porin [Succinivibrio sp.]|nr:porin [Succinivibrio sp.]